VACAQSGGAVGDLIQPGPVLEITIGTIGLVIIMFFHGASMRFINRRFSAAWVGFDGATSLWRVDLVLGLVIAALAIVHLIETLLWAIPVHLLGMIPDLRDAYYYVLESYTTLGEGAVTLPNEWRLVGPVIAMSGLFTFGWTGSVLVSVMNEFSKLDRARAEHRRKRLGRSDDASAP
jgi:hypothetical protein